MTIIRVETVSVCRECCHVGHFTFCCRTAAHRRRVVHRVPKARRKRPPESVTRLQKVKIKYGDLPEKRQRFR